MPQTYPCFWPLISLNLLLSLMIIMNLIYFFFPLFLLTMKFSTLQNSTQKLKFNWKW